MILSELGESEIIKQLILPLLQDGKQKQILLDDCAVLDFTNDCYLLVSTDQISIKPHVLNLGGTYEDVGHYAVTANVSDIAGMGGEPIGILQALMMPKDTPVDQLKSFLKGLKKALDEYNISLIGGDTKEGQNFNVSITIIGSVHRKQILLRKGAKIGDMIFLTGSIGKFFAEYVKHYNTLYKSIQQPKPARPTAKVKTGRLIATSGLCTSCMDMSDGLIASLNELGQTNNLCFSVEYTLLPFANVSYPKDKLLEWKEFVLNQGGDFELLFTMQSCSESVELANRIGVTHIGYVHDRSATGPHYELKGYVGRHQPWEHFRNISANTELLRNFLFDSLIQ